MSPGTPAGSSPARIGRYEVLERIGKGAMGVVYSARDEVMDRVVAVKVMMADLEGEPDTRTRFYREAQAAGRLLHPNIITIFDMGEDEGRIYIVMELLRGQTLAEHLRQPAIPIEQKVDLMVQTCEGLGAAHASGIVHRDIKPGNLFVLQDGSLKILDFGVARLASSTMTASGFIIGTPDYMSPEQARGGDIDPRSDVFSAAAVFYYMLSGRKPFAARDLPTVLRNVQSQPPAPLPESEAPPALARLIMKSLSKEPARRHQSMAELAEDLSRFRRHYEAGTRQIAVTARERYDSIQSLVKEASVLSSRLGLPSPNEPEAAARLREDHPAFVERAPELLLVPFTRPQMAAITDALSAEHEALEQDVERLRRASTALDAVEQALAKGRPEDAAARLQEAAPQLLDVPAAEELRRQCAGALALKAALATKAAEAISLARAEFHAGHRGESLAVLRECLAEEPAAPGIQHELDRFEAEIARLEEAERRQAREEAARAAKQEVIERLQREKEDDTVALPASPGAEADDTVNLAPGRRAWRFLNWFGARLRGVARGR